MDEQSDAILRLAEAEANLAQVRDQIWQTPLPMTNQQREELDAAKVNLHRARAEFDVTLTRAEAV